MGQYEMGDGPRERGEGQRELGSEGGRSSGERGQESGNIDPSPFFSNRLPEHNHGSSQGSLSSPWFLGRSYFNSRLASGIASKAVRASSRCSRLG